MTSCEDEFIAICSYVFIEQWPWSSPRKALLIRSSCSVLWFDKLSVKCVDTYLFECIQRAESISGLLSEYSFFKRNIFSPCDFSLTLEFEQKIYYKSFVKRRVCFPLSNLGFIYFSFSVLCLNTTHLHKCL